MNRGAFDFLTKPIDFKDLEITLKKTLKFVQKIKQQQQQLLEAQAKLKHDAFHDSLTNLPNREWLLNLLQHNIDLKKRRPNYSYAVLFLDLDRFKIINDSLGHSAGDDLLKQVANKLQRCLRKPDTIARFGGDEFVLLLEDVKSIHEVIQITQRIQNVLSEPIIIKNYEIHTRLSIGIVFSEEDYSKPEEVIRDADAAMYRAKAQGKGNYVIFDPKMQASVVESLELEHDLRQGMQSQELFLHYQPIFSISTNQIVAFEALARWQHFQKGWISPKKFIPIAEETGLIGPLGIFVFEQACLQLRQWELKYLNQPISLNINFSPMQFRQPDLIKGIEETLTSTGVNPHQIKLEITESCLLDNDGTSVQILNRFKELGMSLCIDDFGTGYSSLSRLHQFPIDTLKIDRFFLKRTQNPKNWETIKLIIALAHSLDINVVAEGVETVEQLEQLKALHCEFGQGYLFSPHLDSKAVNNFLLAN
jgi:diguanylate cyclase (GGDEF)-like protein